MHYIIIPRQEENFKMSREDEVIRIRDMVARWAFDSVGTGLGTGGIGLIRRAFNLQSPEDLVVGLTAGLLMQGVLENLLAPFVPMPLSAWAIILLLGVGEVLAAQRAGCWRWSLDWGW